MSLYVTDDNGQLHKIAGGGGSSIKIDDVLDFESKNPVQNKTLYNPVSFAENERQKSKNLWSYGDVSGTLSKTIILGTPLSADTYTISAFCEGSDTDSSQCLVIFYGESGATIKNSYYYKNQRSAKTIVAQEPITKITFYASSNYANSKNDTFSFTDIQIELGSTETSYQKHYGVIVHEKQIADVEHIETIYDMSSTDSNINRGYTSGIMCGTGSINVGANPSKYKKVKIYFKLDDCNLSTEVKTSSSDYVNVSVACGDYYASKNAINTFSCRLMPSGYITTLFATYIVNGAGTDKANDPLYIITRIEGYYYDYSN